MDNLRPAGAELRRVGTLWRQAKAGIFLVAVALQRQPYLSVDNLRPTGGEIRRVGRFRGEGVKDADQLTRGFFW